MDECPVSATAALDIMREWQWLRFDPDGNEIWRGRELNEVITRLAFEGVSSPQTTVVSLLCEGDLVARGDYKWHKYQDGNRFQLEGYGELIKPKQWQILADLIADQQRQNSWPIPQVDLTALGLGECPVYEWAFAQCRFNTAICSPDDLFFEAGYMEEWFAAWDIEVWPRFFVQDVPDLSSEPAPQNVSKGGRPPVADWEAAALEIAGRYYRGDFKPQTIAEISRELASWLSDQDTHPSESVLRTHAKRIFDAFQVWERE